MDLEKYKLNQEDIPAKLQQDALRDLGGFAKGAGKGVLSTLQGVGELGQKMVQPFENVLEKVTGIPGPTGEAGTRRIWPKSWETPETTAEEIGFGAEQIGEFLIPVRADEKATVLLTKYLPRIMENPKFTGNLLNLAAKSFGSGLEFASKTVLQTGGDIEQAKVSGIIGAVVPSVASILVGLKKAVTAKLPERLYDQIFKQSTDDLMNYYRTLARGGEINPTLAREVMERGLKGSSENMAIYSIKKLDELENGVQTAVNLLKQQGKKITIDNKDGYIDILSTIKNQFKSGFLSERAKEADALVKELSKVKGNSIDIDLGLKIRRFIDRMRNTSSFRLDPKLTPRQEEFRVATDSLRRKLSDAGLKDLMNEERVYIQAVESIVKDAAARKNVKLLNLTDVLLGGGGLATGFPGAGFGAAAAVRGFQQPFTLTNMGQLLFSGGKAIDTIAPFLGELPKTIPPLITEK